MIRWGERVRMSYYSPYLQVNVGLVRMPLRDSSHLVGTEVQVYDRQEVDQLSQ